MSPAKPRARSRIMAKNNTQAQNAQAQSMTEELRNKYGTVVLAEPLKTSSGKVLQAGEYAIVRATDKTICLGIDRGSWKEAKGWFSWHLGVDGELVVTEKMEAPKPKTKTEMYADTLASVDDLTNDDLKKLMRDLLAPKVQPKAKPQPKAKTVIKTESVHAGAWTVQGDVAVSPKGRKWRVVKAVRDGWHIESKSGIKGTLTNVGKYIAR